MPDDGMGSLSLNASGSFAGHASYRFYVAAFSLEVAFFAAFVVTFSYGTWILCRAHPQTRRQTSNVALLVANVLMFLLAFVHLLLDIYVASLGFSEARPSIESAKFMLYVSQTLIGDGFMIYRLYRVFNRSWAIAVIPTILLLLDAVIGYTSTFVGVVGFYMSVAFYGISLLINIICTVCIMWRVYYLTREFQEVNRRRSNLKIWKVIEATVQSTAIYSAAAVSLVITFVNSTELGYPTCLNIFPALLGLVFSFIVIRIAHNSTRDDSRPTSQLHGSSVGRSTYASNAPILDHQDRSPMRQVFFAEPIVPAPRDGAAAYAQSQGLRVSQMKTGSEASLTLPQLHVPEPNAV
ncbi:hypothetical protein C8Q80DRAFT_1122580 [Daedaleopsis nitida]|nr:hypothetical protein C8Q80DRAFT_1122580 [Daedaleopsis nitida]